MTDKFMIDAAAAETCVARADSIRYRGGSIEREASHLRDAIREYRASIRALLAERDTATEGEPA